jgi:hypothetical protein
VCILCVRFPPKPYTPPRPSWLKCQKKHPNPNPSTHTHIIQVVHVATQLCILCFYAGTCWSLIGHLRGGQKVNRPYRKIVWRFIKVCVCVCECECVCY